MKSDLIDKYGNAVMELINDLDTKQATCQSVEELFTKIQDFVSSNPDSIVINADDPLKLAIGFVAMSKDYKKEIEETIYIGKVKEYKDPRVFCTVGDRLKIAQRLMAGEKLA
jgi:hypothetical protein